MYKDECILLGFLTNINRLKKSLYSPQKQNRPDRISEILGSHADGGPEHTDCTGGLVVKLKCPGVNVDLLQLKVILQTGKQVSHHTELGKGSLRFIINGLCGLLIHLNKPIMKCGNH